MSAAGGRMPVIACLLVLAALLPSPLRAQIRPDADWRTLRTENFYIHFTPPLEDIARRAAVQAESAYAQLQQHLTKPRGKIDLLISDDVDFSNGYATPAPSNRIVVYANPPVSESALRFTDDFLQLVITHELVHLFHLDRVGGVWAMLQKIFGRTPMLFVNGYQPRWMVEGLAVYYESLLTGSGRIVGSEHHMLARAAALEHRFPRVDQLSYVNPHFPYAYGAYAYGSLFMDFLGRTHPDTAMRTFIERSSRRLFPWNLNGASRRAFGESITAEYNRWARSLADSLPPSTPPMRGWEDLTTDGVYAAFPRWLDDTTLIYSGTPGRESYGAYRLRRRTGRTGARNIVDRDRIARRHTRSPNTVLPDGSLLYSELEYTSPYTLRSDLYIDRVRGGKRRLTHGARLSMPDARADGRIVAVQAVPAGTRIALVGADGGDITPITNGSLDEQWAEPRWSPDGRYIAAVRWTRGGTAAIVAIDTTGAVVQTLIAERAVSATPSWSPDGRYVYFASDRTGIMNLYRGAFEPGAQAVVTRVSDTQTGLFEPQLSPSGRELAAVVFKADGYHVGVATVDTSGTLPIPAIERVAPRSAPPVARHDGHATQYSAWRTLRPRAWLPFGEPALDENSFRLGALVSGEDIAERHAYQALMFVPSDGSGLTGSFTYRNAMLGQPLVEVAGSQDWENIACVQDQTQGGACIGDLRRRIREAGLTFTMQRPRSRTFSFASVGGGVEVRDYATDAPSLIDRVDSVYRRTFYYPRVVASAGWSNVQSPPTAISPEDGISVSATSRHRWRTGASGTLTNSLVASASAYKSLDLPGYAHHVIAFNAAGGIQDNRSTGYFEVGGVSGGIVEVFPGYALGEGRRTFGVRGFDGAAQLGIYAFKGSLEYRAPLSIPARGIGALPLFFERTSVSLFADAGAAWCPGLFAARPVPGSSRCTAAEVEAGIAFLEPRLLASFGGEVAISAAILSWDVPYRYRVGVAVPVMGMDSAFGNIDPRVYFAVGVPF
ncbi:MAG TPA: hypothetical protein VEB19_05850 [Gemmatimonadaceae bacterium]|nr:hypothetical protein [Gemmatimonadaceae bacterium]